ncbi:sigma factor-like helix-turn-helix DNA-binding protein, partial [Streptomyces cadmiisoli]
RALPTDLSAFAAMVDDRDDFEAVHGRLQFADAIGHLSERQRDAVILRYGLELETADAAHLMGVAEATVRSFVRQARARLLQVLDIPSDDGKVKS